MRIFFTISALYTIITFLIYWDPSRTIWARFKADSPYTFEKINPALEQQDPLALISITSSEALKEKRASLQKLIWGKTKIPLTSYPSKVQKNFHLAPIQPEFRPQSEDKRSFIALFDAIQNYKGISNIKRIDRLTSENKNEWKAFSAIFYPKFSANRLVIYQNGFASTYHNQWRLIADMIEKGFTVIAHNFRWYGVNFGNFDLKQLDYPMRGFIDPIIISLNYALKDETFKSIDIIGLSAGAWITTLIAAVDQRISRSYPVSGVYPMYLREDNEFPLPYIDSIILNKINYLDLFILGSSGQKRGQLQIFNQFDKCCFRNVKALHYEEAIYKSVRSIGPGRFRVLIDKTHARHKISRFAFNHILKDISRDD